MKDSFKYSVCVCACVSLLQSKCTSDKMCGMEF